jgi:hypothetical protein
MRTARSWTDLRPAARDLAALLRFRAGSLSPTARRRLRGAAIGIGVVTLAVVAYAAWLPGTPRDHPGRVLALIPSALLGFLVLAVVAAVASAGGREVVPRAQSVAFPVSSTTEHLGALLMAPLNIGWILQAWTLLGATAYALGPTRGLLPAELVVLLWIVVATIAAQVVGWLLEGVRRGPHGPWLVRGTTAAAALAFVVLVLSHRLVPLLDHAPTKRVLLVATAGVGGHWLTLVAGVVVMVLAGVLLVIAGAAAAGRALRRPEREELRLESGRHAPRRNPRGPLGAALRLDRAAIWRSVPLRRGMAVLAVMPGGVALAGGLDWEMLAVFPGLVASGGALLFGVNSWCLDGRGALWRDSQPGDPAVAFWSRALVLAEILLGAALVTTVLGALRAGAPTPSELAAVVSATLVVTVQVVSASLRWSVRRPFATDLRSARATPAPPVVMVGYSARLALSTTVTGLVFSGFAALPDWRAPVLVAVPMLLWSLARLVAAHRSWLDPATRARVVVTVAA